MALPIFLLALLALLGYLAAYARQINMTEQLLETAEKAALYRAVQGDASEGYGDGTLRTVYRFSPEVKFPGVGGLWLTAEVKVRPWTGYDGDLGHSNEGEADRMVYISDNQEVYHTSAACSYLDICLTAMSPGAAASERNAYGKRYTACDKCCRGTGFSVVYVSGKGSHYHSTLECSGLSRSPQAVLQSSAEHLPLCSRCGQRNH